MFFTAETTNFVYMLPLFALLGGIVTAVIIYFVSYKQGEGTEPTRLILVGVASNSSDPWRAVFFILNGEEIVKNYR